MWTLEVHRTNNMRFQRHRFVQLRAKTHYQVYSSNLSMLKILSSCISHQLRLWMLICQTTSYIPFLLLDLIEKLFLDHYLFSFVKIDFTYSISASFKKNSKDLISNANKYFKWSYLNKLVWVIYIIWIWFLPRFRCYNLLLKLIVTHL